MANSLRKTISTLQQIAASRDENTGGRIPESAVELMADGIDCGDCHACCKEDRIILHPEDEPFDRYQTEELPSGNVALRIRQDGSCCYLRQNRPRGCSIYKMRPIECRAFNCVRCFKLGLPMGPLTTIAALRRLEDY